MVNNITSHKPSHSYRVFHFGDQCPWRLWVVEQAKLAAQKTGGTAEVFDITDHPEMAQKYQLFYPFMTVIDENIHLPAPFPAKRLVQIVEEGITDQTAEECEPIPAAEAEKVIPLTAENITDTCCLCIPPNQSTGCPAKQTWARSITPKLAQGILGFAACQGDAMVGVVEFLPSQLVPYPIPEKEPSIAFITCIYSSENTGSLHDYRSQVLKHLLEYLPRQGYKKVQVVAGLHTAYPNGPASFFINHGFTAIKDLGTIFLGNGEDRIMLFEKIFIQEFIKQ